MEIHNIYIHIIYMCSNIFKSCRFFFWYLLSKMFNLYIQYNKKWAWISMCWISMCNNNKIDIYENQFKIHIYSWITLVPLPPRRQAPLTPGAPCYLGYWRLARLTSPRQDWTWGTQARQAGQARPLRARPGRPCCHKPADKGTTGDARTRRLGPSWSFLHQEAGPLLGHPAIT